MFICPEQENERNVMQTFLSYSLTVQPVRFIEDQARKGWKLCFDVPLVNKVCLSLVHYEWESERDYNERIQRLQGEQENATRQFERNHAVNEIRKQAEEWQVYHQVLSGQRGQLAGQQHAEAILCGSRSDRWKLRSTWNHSNIIVFLGTIWENQEGELQAPFLQWQGTAPLKLGFRPVDSERQSTALAFIDTRNKG